MILFASLCNVIVIREPLAEQLRDYDTDLINAVRNSDIPVLRRQLALGKTMSACNRHAESVLHMACRRSEQEVVDFLLSNGGQADIIDDYGRTPLHDACWRPEPHFAIVELLLERNVDLIRYADARGAVPLHYTRQEHWAQWCRFLYNQKDKFWPILLSKTSSEESLEQISTSSEESVEHTST